MAAQIVRGDVAGRVWKVLVKPGDRVAADDTLVILECMKMEIPVVAPSAGTVASILVREGDEIVEDQEIAVVV
jgi:acetyl-CoA carboxylase biotin carboxyl carrier protein